MDREYEYNLDEMIEDLTAMLVEEEDYNRTLGMLQLNEEEETIFKRARLHLRRGNPNPLIIKRAYQIFMAKTFHNKRSNSYDTQNILAQEKKDEGLLSLIFSTIKSN